MFGWGPFPNLGVEGIAIATILIQLGIVLYIITKVRQSSWGQQLRFEYFKPQQDLLWNLLRQGLPSTISMMLIALNFFVILFFFSDYGKNAVAAFGVSTRIVQVILLPTVGFNVAALSLTGFNFGAGELGRVKEIWRICMQIALLMMCIGAGVLFAVPRVWLGLFTESVEILDIVESLLRVEAVLLPAYTTLFLGVAVLQGLKKPMFGMILGVIF